ncbi:surfactin synthetase subunit 3 [Verticillium dahliae VdLs.17]|uniref:Brevianamide F synthase n=1 Tax=Verticillium dahliae (strain VdLs.17 / ATCC MYA-4575 / FGSC 10137) TaxID=498257 RepID=G2X135_VERDV|nr:surfactin synthetase subunit 3 [Verticillium dahliae VdLs.17]EGY22526.1 surfactin synthetase subunit 3 [Verticillium dahliae VdLs.17]
MYLRRDSESGGTAVSSARTPENNTSSTRTIPFTPRSEVNTTAAPKLELLLAWILVLYRENDDGSQISWGARNTGGQSSETSHSLDLSNVPFQKTCSLTSALEAVQQLDPPTPEQESTTQHTLFFNNGSEAAKSGREKDSQNNFREWTYQVEVSYLEQELTVKADWSRTAMSTSLATTRLNSFIDILTTILDHPERSVSDATGPTLADLDQLWSWNATLPPLMEQCMHDLITEQAASQPDAHAIESWDGTFTYAEVEDLSTRLAKHLVARGAQVGGIIPLCFEKSRWTIVALLAVMKAGSAFALTDPSQPEARLRTIVEQTDAKLLITSQLQSTLGERIAGDATTIVVVSGETLEQLTPEPDAALPTIPTSSPLYIQFTSGSTGKPKGVMCSHENYTSGAVPRADLVGYRSHSRVFDFASYAFDVSIDCMLCTLANGGCLCIPSDEDRMNDLSDAIRKSKSNMAHMTPSVARVLDPNVIPSLEVLGLGGEAVSAGDASAWSQSAKVIIAYGPSECTVGCTINGSVSSTSTNIGKGTGGLTWIVDPDDHDRLMPVGAVGELLIEGPVVGLGYLNDPTKTAEVFIKDPTWLLAGGGGTPGRHGLLYKTGDLVRYDPDGTGAIAFVGRKDQQVKLRGQRIELAEVEHHLRGKLPSSVKLAAEVIKPGGTEPTLVAFIVEQASAASDDGEGDLTTLSAELSQIVAEIDTALGAEIPRYMVPSSYIPLRKMPSLVSGKIDRKRLRELGSSMSREEVARLRAVSAENTAPQSDMEKALHRSWVKILGTASEIGLQDSFFALGGDSLRAMRLVAAARDEGVVLTVANIFNCPTLKDMAATATTASQETQEAVEPFSLLDKDWTREAAVADVAKLCEIEEATVEDVYPCTPLQEALMALSAKVKEAYVAQRVVDLDDAAMADKLRLAFDAAATDCPILRTRIVQVPQHGLVQVVVNEKIAWHLGDDLQGYLVKDRDEAMDLGKPLVRYALITSPESSKVYFVLTMHHALYDGWSMPLVVDRVNKAYDGQKVQRPAEFRNFIRYLNAVSREEGETFWRERLQGANGPQFPALPYEGYQTQADSLLEIHVPLSGRPASNTTVATVIRGAWAYVASRYSATTDVVFGETLTGRNAALRGAEEIEGPMITTIPFRVQIHDESSVTEYIQEIQDLTAQQIPYEHTGLQHIRRLSPDAYEACELRTGLVLHPSAEGEAQPNTAVYPADRLVPAGDSEAAQEALKFNTYALMLVCALDSKGFSVMASFDSNTVEKSLMERALDQFARVATQLCEMTDAPIRDLRYLTNDDQVDLWRASIKNPQSVQDKYPETRAVWIVDPQECTRLAPLEALGELVVVSTADLSLPTMDEPLWLDVVNGHADEQRAAKFFKTGKLAKLSADGSVQITEKKSAAAKSAAPSRPVKKISATSAKQRRLRTLWSRVLRLTEEDIGLNDSFFRLGGDSISAMKLVSEARADNLRLTVAQVFKNRTLFDMASVLEDSEPTQNKEAVEPLEPFELVEEAQATKFLVNTVRPALADNSWNVIDVLPTRPLQDAAIKGTIQLPRFSARYEAMYFDGDVNKAQLYQSCQELVTRNEILRTVFIAHKESYLGVVLEHIETPVAEYEIDGDVEPFVRQLCTMDSYTRMPLGSCFVKWFFVQSSSGPSALIFRVSHAQYDEICLPVMLQQLSALHEGKPVPSSLPFSSYVGHVVKSNIPKGLDYWRDLLKGSSLSVLKPDTPVVRRNHFAVHRQFDISARSKDMTVATLPTAAWALCLARRLATRDVTFGEVVSGRTIDFPNADAVVGPCWQYVPLRVQFAAGWTAADLLAHVQSQHIASSAHEGVGLPEVVRRCTDWPASVDWFDSVVHQDVEHVESLGFAGVSGRMETIYPHEEPLREWKIQAFPEGDKLTIEVITFESWAEHAKELLAEVGAIVESLVREPEAVLFE